MDLNSSARFGSPASPSAGLARESRHQKKPPRPLLIERPGWRNCVSPAMTDFRAFGTIMGLAGLTAVFGMGTGVAPPVWSPGRRPWGNVRVFHPRRSQFLISQLQGAAPWRAGKSRCSACDRPLFGRGRPLESAPFQRSHSRPASPRASSKKTRAWGSSCHPPVGILIQNSPASATCVPGVFLGRVCDSEGDTHRQRQTRPPVGFFAGGSAQRDGGRFRFPLGLEVMAFFLCGFAPFAWEGATPGGGGIEPLFQALGIQKEPGIVLSVAWIPTWEVR